MSTTTRKIISAVLCGAFALIVMLVLDKTQAHASVPAVAETSSVSTACCMFTCSCPPLTASVGSR